MTMRTLLCCALLPLAALAGEPVAVDVSVSARAGSATSQSHPNAAENVPLSIFATHEGDEVKYFSNYRLYAMTVEQGGAVVADFIPALNPEGVPGLYDLANGRFLTNQGADPFGYKTGDQWFRLTVTQVAKSGATAMDFAEFALYDAAGVRQNLGLTEASGANSIGPGQFYHDKKGGITWGDGASKDAFDGNLVTRLGLTLKNGTYDGTGVLTDPQVLVMHLRSDAAEVVKYNFCTADYGSDSFSPVAWTLERSYDGHTWETIVRKTKETSEYATAGKTWYRSGGTGATPAAFFQAGNWGRVSDQWFRLTIQKKLYDSTAGGYALMSLQLSEFALFDAAGNRQDLGLELGEASGPSLYPGELHYDTPGVYFWYNESPAKLFDGSPDTKMGVDYEKTDLSGLSQGEESLWQVMTLRLPGGASEVVGYNFCSGSDTRNYPARAPTAWTLERSSDGRTWQVCDIQVEATSGWTVENKTWYNGGNSYETSEFIEVTLDGNGGSPESQTVYVGQGRALPPIAAANLPTKTGCIFAGYWSAAEGGVKYYNADGTGARECDFTVNATLYARWLEGFEPLAKLNFDGTHYILTDYVPTANTWIETDLQTMGSNVAGGSAALFGLSEKVAGGTAETAYYGMNLSGGSKVVYGWAMGSEVAGAAQQNGKCWYYNNDRYILSVRSTARFGYSGFEVRQGATVYRGVVRADKTWKMDNRFPCHTALAIGGYNGSLPAGASGKMPGYGTSVSPYSFTDGGLDVYSFKIYESENGSPADAVQTLRHDFVPVMNVTDGVAGFYDFVGDRFHPLRTQTIVTLNANGGNALSTNYVYATAGEAMPSPIEVPTRQGYAFQGYAAMPAEDWPVPMYYGADGTSDKTYPAANGPTELYAQWELAPTEITGVLLAESGAVYDGSAKTPQIAAVMTASGLRLTVDDAALGWDVAYERERVATDNLTDVGNVSVVVTGRGRLSGSARADFRIYDPKRIPLPKPSQLVYKYTGFSITPTFDPSWARAGYTTGGQTSGTEKGEYAVTCTLKSGYTWENGSTMPYVVKWAIGDSFLERLANDGRNVALDSSPYAEGGDLVLHDEDLGVYIHVFTNTAAAATFTARQDLNAELLVVGGGGSGGDSGYSDVGGGGGAGGVKYVRNRTVAAGAYEVNVGKGGAGSISNGKGNNGTGSCFGNSVFAVEVHGGGGGGVGMGGVGSDGASGGGHGANWNGSPIEGPGGTGIVGEGYDGGKGVRIGQGQAAAGGGGGAGGPGGDAVVTSGGCDGGAGGAGLPCDILGFAQYFGGGGGGGTGQAWHSGGAGGIGGGSSAYDRGARGISGENGLGGGSGGGNYTSTGGGPGSGAGGDGIVIIRYADPLVGKMAPVPVGKTLDYIGKTLVGVDELPGSTLSGDYYGDVGGVYTAVATLAPGYTQWSDGSIELSREIEWEIVDTKTWYLVESDNTDNWSETSFKSQYGSETNPQHWNRDPNATKGVSHWPVANYNYVVPAGKVIALVSNGGSWYNNFAGESLTLSGTMRLRQPNTPKYIRNFVARGGLFLRSIPGYTPLPVPASRFPRGRR